MTAHDLHEAPWGDGRQLDTLIDEGLHGDAVLIPEPLRDVLPIAGRGSATWKVTIRREGPPVHEVMRPRDEPSVIAAGAELVARLGRLEQELAASGAPDLRRGQRVHRPIPLRRDLQSVPAIGAGSKGPGAGCRAPIPPAVERDFRALLADLAAETGTAITCDWIFDPRRVHARCRPIRWWPRFKLAIRRPPGTLLPTGPKPFVDDGNSFSALAGVPAITHGRARGASIRFRNGSRSTILYASRGSMRRSRRSIVTQPTDAAY